MSTPSYKRQRSDCAPEEENVGAFVDSCVEFYSNVTFHTSQEGAAMARAILEESAQVHPMTVLLLGSATALSDAQRIRAEFPYAAHIADVKAAMDTAPQNKAHVVAVSERARVLVGVVTVTASRHNCPVRPDIIHKIIKAAISECPNPGAPLDVYFMGAAGDRLPVATAIARASNRSFSAKKGMATSRYYQPGNPVRVVIPDISKQQCADLAAAANSVQLCQRLVDAPTNLLDTTTFAEIAALWIDKLKRQGHNVSIDVVQGEQLREQGYGGLYGTGKAAEYPPHLVTLSYKPAEGIAPKDKIAFVGKGIVYDTGGLAIKPRDGMCTMKHDMGGAAAIFGGFLSLVQLRAPVEVSCIMCLADNAVGPRAQRNDDIVIMKSGVTVEINNTDAEGRLVLSDGVYHASAELPYTPNIIVDMATLTGAQGVATGKYHAAIYANTDAAETRFMAAGKASGDLVFPVLYTPEFHNEEFSSAIADYRNSVRNRANAQCSCAAQFVGNNLARTYTGEWVHVDLASPATYDEGTGFGVALLLRIFATENYQ